MIPSSEPANNFDNSTISNRKGNLDIKTFTWYVTLKSCREQNPLSVQKIVHEYFDCPFSDGHQPWGSTSYAFSFFFFLHLRIICWEQCDESQHSWLGGDRGVERLTWKGKSFTFLQPSLSIGIAWNLSFNQSSSLPKRSWPSPYDVHYISTHDGVLSLLITSCLYL